MSILGSAFGRALAGSGAAAANISSRYIDEELAQQRAQAFADIAQQGRNNERSAAFAFQNDPNNVATANATDRARAVAKGETDDTVMTNRLGNTVLNEAARTKVAGDAEAARRVKVDELSDPALNAATRAKTADDADAATTNQINALSRMANDPKVTEAKRTEAALKLEALKGELEARAKSTIDVVNATEDARSRSGAYDRSTGGMTAAKLPPGVKAELDALDKRDEQINAAMVRAQADGMWDPAKNPSQKQLQTQQSANRMRRSQIIAPYLEGGGGKADPLGMRTSSTSPTKLAGNPGDPNADPTKIPPDVQAARDVQAGSLVVQSEYGGDIAKARDALARLVVESASAQGEARTMIRSEAERLKKGIDAYENRGQATEGKGGSLLERAAERKRARTGGEAEKPQGMAAMDDRTLERIAAIDGHTEQAKAKAELRRRGQQPADAVEDPMNGLGA